MLKITVVLEPSADGGFTASVPTIPGCFSEGETVGETLANIREAVEMILEATEDDRVVGEGAKLIDLLAAWQDQPPTVPPPAPDATPGASPEEPQGRPRPRRNVQRITPLNPEDRDSARFLNSRIT